MFLSIYYIFSLEIDHIIGCGQRRGRKYFLVRFKHSQQNEVIDWDAAKNYSVQVMEFFGSRLKWASMDNIDDSDNEMQDDQQTENDEANLNNTSNNLLDNAPNDIQFAQ